MKPPKMILFDYGQTLLYEPDFDLLRGEKELFKYVVENPRQITAEQSHEFAETLFNEYGTCRKQGFEMHEWQMLRYQYEYLDIKLSISYPEAERILWDNTSSGAKMPGVEELLDFLYKKGIRSGVISNIGWSGAALTERINRLLPKNHFEFIIASSEYGFRKPSPRLFELALRKAGLNADEVWYCGDSIRADIIGANSAGIYPVLYENLTIESPWQGQNDGIEVDFDYLHIHEWSELITILESVKIQ